MRRCLRAASEQGGTMTTDLEQVSLPDFSSAQFMLDSVTDFEIISLDTDGVVLTWNKGAQNLTGYVADEVIGRNVSIFYTDEDRENGMVERELRTAAELGRCEYEGWRVRKGGEPFWASLVLSPIHDTDGKVQGFVKVARDLSERRNQEERLRRQRDEIVELSTPVILVWDRVLVLPLIGTLDSNRAALMTETLLQRIAKDHAEVVILDISGVPTIDTQVAQHLIKTVQAAKLMGATSIMCGVRPETAQTIIHLGIELAGLRSCSDLRDALQLAIRLLDATAASNGAAEGVLQSVGKP
jgi:PAS domain S-box-containing protein